MKAKLVGIFLISLSFAFLSGTARGCHHASRDYHNESKLVEWLDKDWYDGVGMWNQSYPWTADFTHTMMHVQVLALLLAGVMFAFWWIQRETCGKWWKFMLWCLLWLWLAWFIEGRGMTLPYHVILGDRSCDYSVWVWLRGWIY